MPEVNLLTHIAPENKILSRLTPNISQASYIFIAVSFIQKTGLKHLFEKLKDFLDSNKRVTIFTSGYLGITDPEALNRLLWLREKYETLEVFFNPNDRFHSKFFLFENKSGYSLFLGSSNISLGGLADSGELNVEIKGRKKDQIHKDINIVIENLKKNQSFKELNQDIIRAYAKMYSKKVKNKKIKIKNTIKNITLKTETMPVFVVDSHFSEKEVKRISEIHPRWTDYVSMSPKFKKLKRNDLFLNISNVRGEKGTFNVSKYIEHDRVKRVGVIAKIKCGEEISISKLNNGLGINKNKLLRRNYLDIYDIAILRRDFKKAFAG